MIKLIILIIIIIAVLIGVLCFFHGSTIKMFIKSHLAESKFELKTMFHNHVIRIGIVCGICFAIIYGLSYHLPVTPGWRVHKGKWYYVQSNGSVQTGWSLLNNKWYFFNDSGVMLTGWVLLNNNWYYFDNTGAMTVNQWIGNYWVGDTGAMATNQWVGDYWVDNTGACIY